MSDFQFEKLDELYMNRCIMLAKKGLGHVSPNPMVGAILVHNNKVIGEGFHASFGGKHAEVNAIESVKIKDKPLISKSTLYVSLEPCTFFGKTPPCANRIKDENIPKVVIGCLDTNPLVSGKGVAYLKAQGINVSVGIQQHLCIDLNKRFNTFQTKKRPYVILKWAQSLDGFFTKTRTHQTWITNKYSRQIVHKWRSEEAAILVGKKTLEIDNPKLTTRYWHGNNPLRISIDRYKSINHSNYIISDNRADTLLFTQEKSQKINKQAHYIQIDFLKPIIPQILSTLFDKGIDSLIVEGGEKTISSFIKSNIWDEARILVAGSKSIYKGVTAPKLDKTYVQSYPLIGEDYWEIYLNDTSPNT